VLIHLLNSQLLDMMLDVNCCEHIPGNLRFDLDLPTSSKDLVFNDGNDTDTSYDSSVARIALEEASEELARGEIDEEGFNQLGKRWEAKRRRKTNHATNGAVLNGTKKPRRSFKSLLAIPHTELKQLHDSALPQDLRSPLFPPTSFLPPSDEDAHIQDLNGRVASIDRDSNADYVYTPLPTFSHPPSPPPSDLGRDHERDNPVSVTNWLRKHQPQIFLQDNDHLSDKEGPPVSNRKAGGRKKALNAALGAPVIAKTEPLEDEEGDSWMPSAGKKRKVEGDEKGYNPRKSSGSGKRKREDSSFGEKQKKPRKSFTSID
jgi:IEC3 subunit of the Ino80 complex, chromatin re-modelling